MKNMNAFDLKPLIIEDKGSEIVLDLPCSEDERAFFNGYQTWTPSFEVKPGEKQTGADR